MISGTSGSAQGVLAGRAACRPSIVARAQTSANLQASAPYAGIRCIAGSTLRRIYDSQRRWNCHHMSLVQASAVVLAARRCVALTTFDGDGTRRVFMSRRIGALGVIQSRYHPSNLFRLSTVHIVVLDASMCSSLRDSEMFRGRGCQTLGSSESVHRSMVESTDIADYICVVSEEI